MSMGLMILSRWDKRHSRTNNTGKGWKRFYDGPGNQES